MASFNPNYFSQLFSQLQQASKAPIPNFSNLPVGQNIVTQYNPYTFSLHSWTPSSTITNPNGSTTTNSSFNLGYVSNNNPIFNQQSTTNGNTNTNSTYFYDDMSLGNATHNYTKTTNPNGSYSWSETNTWNTYHEWNEVITWNTTTQQECQLPPPPPPVCPPPPPPPPKLDGNKDAVGLVGDPWIESYSNGADTKRSQWLKEPGTYNVLSDTGLTMAANVVNIDPQNPSRQAYAVGSYNINAGGTDLRFDATAGAVYQGNSTTPLVSLSDSNKTVTLPNGVTVGVASYPDGPGGVTAPRLFLKNAEYDVSFGRRQPHPDNVPYFDTNFAELKIDSAWNATSGITAANGMNLADYLRLGDTYK